MKKQEILIILIPTLIFVIAWIGFNIYDNSITSTISPQEATQINPIKPTFNTKAIQELKKREKVEPYYQETSSNPTPTPTIDLKLNLTKINQATTGGKLNK